MPPEPSGPLQIDLSGQVAIVTGASRGIGQSVAQTLSRCGAWVACVARDREKLQETVAAITQTGGSAEAFAADVTNREDVENVVAEVLKRHDQIHILVNNAGITRDALLLRMDDEQWQQVIDTNLKGTFLFTRAVARPMMQQRYGRIINMTSVVGLVGNPGQANYAASKAGIIGLTRSVARELARRGVTLNAVAPGFITTDMTQALPESVRDQIRERIPIHRLGEAHEVASLVAFLASRHAGYLTGQVICLDGGMTS